jgi:hypothetical protein
MQEIVFFYTGISHATLEGQCHEIFDFGFFHKSVSPKPPRIPIGLFQIRGDIRSSSAPPVLLTPVENGKNHQSEKF